ncbi:uncharacterized protein EHS24_003692 [Apiotrichum porosum]|uniref:Uncharacterized protein n=1 Tax=Apiotrichum porosum TaxID=105984 RepID=A0A427XDY7_9TREE|nr:uncharacterized protein EHS24_003692 [Apiotrichum porosum]RSH77066.1 hypothetical protein EHS24_003692 [Apiotrichum porosum]
MNTSMSTSPPMGIPEDHVRMTKGPRRNSCEARPGLIESTHIAPLNEGIMAPDHAMPTMMATSPPMGIPADHVRPNKGPRRNSCEARPGLIESTHLAPLNEGLMAPEPTECDLSDDQMAKLY